MSISTQSLILWFRYTLSSNYKADFSFTVSNVFYLISSSAFVPPGAKFMAPVSISDKVVASGYVTDSDIIIIIQAQYWDQPRSVRLEIG